MEEINTALERLSKEELIALIKLMLRKEPELEILLELPLPTSAGQQAPVTPEVYHHLVEKAFHEGGNTWGAEAGIADDLLTIVEMGDAFAARHDYSSAAMIYEEVITGILTHFDDYENENGDLEGVVTECVTELGAWLGSVQDDSVLREKLLGILFEVYRFDVEDAGGISISDDAVALLEELTTAEERRVVAGWVRERLSRLSPGSSYSADYEREWYGGFLLDLEADTLDDETFLRISRETGRSHDVVNRLLELGRVDEAVQEAERVSDYDLLSIADLFVEHGQEAIAERLIQERSQRSNDTRLLEWLKKHYLVRGEQAAALKLAEDLFYKTYVSLVSYQEIRQLATALGQWDTIRPRLLAFLEKSKKMDLLIQIALDEHDMDKALELLKAENKPISHGYGMFGYNTIALEVAKAAEETRPRAAIEIYQKYAEALINQRGRASYQMACNHLVRVRDLYTKLGENDAWTSYITGLRDRNRSLRALKEELANAGL